MKARVTYRMAAALAHWKKCESCRGTRDGAIDEAIGCLLPEFAPLRARQNELQEEYAEIEAERMRLVERPIPKRLRGPDWLEEA